MHSLKDLIQNSLKRAGIEKQVEASIILGEYSKIIVQIFGNKILEDVKPLYVRRNVLFIACMHPVISQELKFREKHIMEELFKRRGVKLLGIRYRL